MDRRSWHRTIWPPTERAASTFRTPAPRAVQAKSSICPAIMYCTRWRVGFVSPTVSASRPMVPRSTSPSRRPARCWPFPSRRTDHWACRMISFGFATSCPRAEVGPSRQTRCGSICTATSSSPYTTVVAWRSCHRPAGFLRCSTCHPSITPTLPSAPMAEACTSPRSTTTPNPPIAADRSDGQSARALRVPTPPPPSQPPPATTAPARRNPASASR